MGNVNMPAPVAVAGGALCLLGGYLIGVVAGPDTTSRTTADVVSYDPDDRELCLGGGAVSELPEAEGGVLCGTWQRTSGARTPVEGDDFRFVTMTSQDGGSDETVVFIYGDVER